MTTTSSITIAGNLTRDAEIRYTRDGQATTALSVAVNHRWQNRQTQEWEESTTSFFDVVCWRDLAENAALSLGRGARIVVTGRLEQRSWETDDGETRTKVSWWPTTSAPASVLPPWTSTRWSGTPQPRIPSHPKRSSDHQASGVPPGTPLLRVRSSRR
jgi:single-stranded DNA-binding protein